MLMDLHFEYPISNIQSQLAYAKSQIEWAKKNKETWEEARAEVDKIDES
jgi:hypothetical protein